MAWPTRALRFTSWSVRRKLVALLVAASLVPIVVATLLDIRAARRDARDSAGALLAAHTDQLRNQLDAFNTAYLLSASKLGRLPDLIDLGRRPTDAVVLAEVHAILAVHVASDAALDRIAVVDRAGTVLVASTPQLDHRSLATRDYVEAGLRGTHTAWGVYTGDPLAEAPPSLVYVAPLRDGSTVLGLVVLWVRASAIAELARGANELAGRGAFAVLLDADGVRIAHSSDEHMLFHPAGPLPRARLEALVAERKFGDATRALLEDVRPFPALFERATAAVPALAMFRGFAASNQHWNYGVGRRLTSAPWTIAYLLPVASLDEQLASQTVDKLILAAIIMLLAFGGGLFLASMIQRPVGALSAATARIAEGDLTARVPAGGDDELGRLCASFNAMAERIERDDSALRHSRDELEDRVAERTGELVRASVNAERAREAAVASAGRLELLSRTSHELAVASGELERVLELAARSLGEAIGDAVAIRLLSDDGAWLEPTSASYHRDPEARARIAQAIGGVRTSSRDGFGGRVATTGEAVLLATIGEALPAAIPPAFQMLARAAGITSLLAVPLRSRERTIGVVILLRNRIDDPYTVDDQRFAQDVADRAGLAIDNAVLVDTLERRVAARTSALESANAELEAFSYSVSHDLRAPLRSIDAFSSILLSDHATQLDDDGQRALQRIRNATGRMAALIDDLLNLARITRSPLRWAPVDVSAMASQIAGELARREPARTTAIHIAPGLAGRGDARLLAIVFDNLLGNAWKFTAKQRSAEIWIGAETQERRTVFFVRDTGAGFDMQYADKLFLPFQRLHSTDEFEGVGVGLATVHRIIAHHGGKIWAKSKVGEGATFLFFLGEPPA